jgi:carbon-monoxide dehydrogenase medium subunit
MVGVMVAETPSGIRVGVTGAGPCAFRVPEMEKALTAKFSADSVAGITIPSDGLNADLHGSADYRAHLVTVMAKRAAATIA